MLGREESGQLQEAIPMLLDANVRGFVGGVISFFVLCLHFALVNHLFGGMALNFGRFYRFGPFRFNEPRESFPQVTIKKDVKGFSRKFSSGDFVCFHQIRHAIRSLVRGGVREHRYHSRSKLCSC